MICERRLRCENTDVRPCGVSDRQPCLLVTQMGLIQRRNVRLKQSDSSCWEQLPLDVQMHILSRLPLEAVLRFRSVCKQWSALTNSPHFRSLHARNTSNSYIVMSVVRGSVRTTRCHKRSSFTTGKPSFERISPAKVASFIGTSVPEGSEPSLSAGGLLLCISRNCFWVGNPLTRQWVKVPPVRAYGIVCYQQLLPYTTCDGEKFFKFWIDPYMFDSRVGIWTLPEYQTVWNCSHNTLHLGGKFYALGRCRQHHAVVLLALEGGGDFSTLSESPWVYAWDYDTLRYVHTYLVEVGGRIGMIVQQLEELVVLVLDLQTGVWSRVSALPRKIARCTYIGACCSRGKLTFVPAMDGMAVFDSESLTWEWIEEMKMINLPYRMFVLEPSLTATPGLLNEPSQELAEACVSLKYGNARYHQPWQGSFSGLDALSKSGMSWVDIGRLAVDRSKGGEFRAVHLREDDGIVVENLWPWNLSYSAAEKF